jgi:hypothetical protein
MRNGGRILVAVFCLVLVCSAIGALSGGRADFSERGTTFHKPHQPLQAIETAPVGAATSSADELIAAPGTGRVLRLSFGTRVVTQQTSRVIVPALETALDQRPPPRASLA